MAGRLNESDEFKEVHEINVTPFIDVMLVLLIIFMVTAPLVTVDAPVDLPASTATPQKRPDRPLYLTLRKDLSLLLGEDALARDALRLALEQASGGDRETRLFLRADGSVDYRDLMQLMNALRDAGYLKVALVGIEASPTHPGSP